VGRREQRQRREAAEDKEGGVVEASGAVVEVGGGEEKREVGDGDLRRAPSGVVSFRVIGDGRGEVRKEEGRDGR